MERESGGKRVEVDMADKGDERVWRESLVKKKKKLGRTIREKELGKRSRMRECVEKS